MYWKKGYVSFIEKVYFINSICTGRKIAVVPRGTGAPSSLGIEYTIEQINIVPDTLFAI